MTESGDAGITDGTGAPGTTRSGGTVFRFAITGTAGLGVNLLVLAVLLRLSVHPYAASAIAFEAAVLWNFVLNDRWTFRHRNLAGGRRRRGIHFNLVSLATLAIKVAAFVLLSHAFPAGSALLHQALAVIPGALANYLINNRWTFAGHQRSIS